MKLAAELTAVSESLPDTIGFTSAPVWFVVGDKICAGQYHANGFFYKDGGGVMAVGDERAAGKYSCAANCPRATHWCYTRDLRLEEAAT